MSSRRIVSSCAFMAAIVAAGSWYAVSAFPLQHSMTFVPAPAQAQQDGPGPLEQRANPITPENPVPRRVTSENMAYPAEAAAIDARGEMTLQITLDEFGRVAEARPKGFGIHAPGFEMGITTVTDQPFSARGTARAAEPGKATGIREVHAALVRAATDAVKQWRYDPPFKAPISFPVTFRFGSDPPPDEMAFQVRPDGAHPSEGVVRVGDGGIGAPAKLRDVKPVYPPIAQAAGVQGIVMMEIRIEPDGTVGTATVMRSIPLLDGAALDAVKQWQFKPTLLNGQPVAVMMTVTINFTLDGLR